MAEMKLRKEKAIKNGKLYGIGYTAVVEPSVSNMGYITTALPYEEREKSGHKGGAIASASVAIGPMGGVYVTCDSLPQGQGHKTVLAQVVADIFGISFETVNVNTELDTQKDPWSIAAGNYSSRFAGAVAGTTALAAKKLKTKISNLNQIKKIDIFTSHHTHYVIGTGANDPQKMDPNASRETLDHSIMYIFAVALEDGDWHHVKSYTKARANRKSTIKIWKSITTYEDKKWTKKYHDPNPKKKSFGARVVVTLNNGKKITEQLDRADAHPYGARPFKRQNYINKFLTLTDGILDKKESNRFLKTVQNLKNLKAGQLDKLNIEVKKSRLKRNLKKGIF